MLAYFSTIYYHSKFQSSALSGATVASNKELHTAAMLVLLTVGN
jgi:hypothetical protein